MSDEGAGGERKFEVEIAPPSERPRRVIDAKPDPTNDPALASTFDEALAHDGKSDQEILEEKHDAELAVAGAAIVVGAAVAIELAREESEENVDAAEAEAEGEAEAEQDDVSDSDGD